MRFGEAIRIIKTIADDNNVKLEDTMKILVAGEERQAREHDERAAFPEEKEKLDNYLSALQANGGIPPDVSNKEHCKAAGVRPNVGNANFVSYKIRGLLTHQKTK